MSSLKFAGVVVAAMILPLSASLYHISYTPIPTLAQETTNQSSKERADQLLQQGIQQLQTSQFEAAFQLWQQALAIYRDIKDLQGEGRTLGYLGLVYYSLGDYPKAVEYHRQSLVIARQIKNRLGEGQALGNLGLAYRSLGDYPKAINYLQQSLAIVQHIKDRQGEGIVLGNLGLAYRSLGDYPKAVEYHRQSLAIARQIKNRLGEGQALGNLGNAYYSLGDYPKAIEYHQQSLAIAQQIKDRQGEGASLGNLGNAYYSLGDYPKAIEYHQQSLAIAQQIKNRLGEEQSLSNLGNAYYSLGDYPKAVEYHQQGLAIAQQIKDRQGEGAVLGNLGNAYYSLGDYSKAIEYHQQRLVVTQQIKDRQGEEASLSNLGNAYYSLGDYSKAIEYHQQSLAIAQQIKDRQGEGSSLSNLGNAYYFLKNYPKATNYHQQSLTIAQQIKNRLGEGDALGNLGNTYYSLKDLRRAIEYHQKALLIFRQARDRAKEGLALSNISKVLTAQNQLELAIVFYKQSVNVRESIRKKVQKLSREEQQYYTQSVASSYRDLASLLLQKGRVMEALQVLDLLKVQELQDFFKDVKGNEQTAQGVEMLIEERLILQKLNTTFLSDLNKSLKSSTVTVLVQQLRQTAPAQNLKLAAYTDLQIRLQNIGTNSALLYPLILDDRIELVLFTRNAPPIHRTINIKQAELEQAVRSFRAAIQQKDSQNIRQPANQLYNWLIKPIEADLQQANIKTLIYAPDGQMRYVPLAALYDGKQWLVEKYQINYITALSLTNIATRSPQPPHILAGAFTDSTGRVQVNGQAFDFGAIPSALSEVESLAKQFPNTTKLVDKDFDHAGMTFDRLNRYNIIHLATHGKLVAGAPEDSFILLNNNEYITLREIKDWKLPNVALVVLSACQTALGDKLGSGIEIIGFGYQLQQAQARASIATLWEINDASTGNLMHEFYTGLQVKQLPPVEALREAQITLITDKGQYSMTEPRSSVNYPPGQNQTATINRDLSHPYYWAPFILIGNGL